jgi:hypothetical protein
MEKAHMRYQNSIDFILSQMESSADEHENIMLAIWKEKEKLIDKIWHHYNAVFAAFCDNPGGKFERELEETYAIFQKNNSTDTEPPEPEMLNDNVVKEYINEMLKVDYVPPNDLVDVQAHLTALWCFYHIFPTLSPTPFPLSAVMRFDLALTKLLRKSYMLIMLMMEMGRFSDKEHRRFENIRKQKRKEENRQLIIKTHKNINTINKSDHAIAKEIHIILKNQYQDPPGLNTIKRRLKEINEKKFI